MKAIVAVLVLAGVALAGGLAYRLRRRPARAAASADIGGEMQRPGGSDERGPATSGSSGAAPIPRAPHEVAAASTSVQHEVAEVIARRLPALESEAQVDGYLGELEAQARRHHQVTALEVQPGVAAIRQLESQLGVEWTIHKIADFTQEMTALSATLDGRDQPEPPPPSLDDLARTIELGNADERAAAIRSYTNALRGLPLPEQQRATARLNELAGAAH